jgi:uncharacterized protein (TIGR00156 family)
MKKSLILFFILFLLINNNIEAKFYVENQEKVNTILQIKKMKDNEIVTLRGNIKKQLENDEFIFADKTGEIKIEVSDNILAEMSEANIENTTAIIVTGKLDKESFKKDTIDVFKIEIIK